MAITLSDVFSVSKRILKNNGIFAIVHRPERLLEIFDEFRKNNMEPKRLRFVYSKFGQPATMVLVEGVKNGKAGLKIDYPFILYEQDGSPTEEYETLLKEVKK